MLRRSTVVISGELFSRLRHNMLCTVSEIHNPFWVPRGPAYVIVVAGVPVVCGNHGIVPHKPAQQVSVHDDSHRTASSNSLKLSVPACARREPQFEMNFR